MVGSKKLYHLGQLKNEDIMGSIPQKKRAQPHQQQQLQKLSKGKFPIKVCSENKI
jgi:hypothetical protein